MTSALILALTGRNWCSGNTGASGSTGALYKEHSAVLEPVDWDSWSC